MPHLLQMLLGSALGADQTPITDPRFGDQSIQVDENGQLVDANGNPTKNQSGVLPYNQPNFATKLFNPEVANQEAMGNNAYLQAPGLAQKQNTISRDVAATNYNQLPDFLKAPQMTTPEAISAGYPNARSPGDFNAMNEGVLDARAGLPSILSQTDITQAGTGLGQAQATAAMQPQSIELQEAQLANNLHKATGLDPLELKNAITAERLRTGFIPKEAKLRNIVNDLQYAQTKQARALQEFRGRLTPLLGAQMKNEAEAGAYQSQFLPTAATPNELHLKPDNTVELIKSPGYVNPFQQRMSPEALSTEPVNIGSNLSNIGISLPGGVPLRTTNPNKFSVLTGEKVGNKDDSNVLQSLTPAQRQAILRLLSNQIPSAQYPQQ